MLLSLTTSKRFFKKEGVINLKVENKKYTPIVLSEGEFHTVGRVVGLLRKFRSSNR
jgi:SOS-response transcriptional repressor LexA